MSSFLFESCGCCFVKYFEIYQDFHKSESSESLGRLFAEDTKENTYVESDIPVKVVNINIFLLLVSFRLTITLSEIYFFIN